MTNLFLGIDTSCYTTSLALMDEEGNLVGDYRKPLEVETGKIGLRQSHGFFMHVGNLPVLYADLVKDWDPKCIKAIGVSTRPRNVQDSYMPVFTAGEHFANTVALSLGVKVLPFSHQEGHIEASKWSAKTNVEPFMALHLSGGTSELLLVNTDNGRYQAHIVGGAKDISAGKLIDRVGVHMGLAFPAGKEMDSMITFSPKHKWGYPTSVKDGWINLSGLENYAKKKYDQDQNQSNVAEGLFEAIAKSLLKVLKQASETHRVKSILFGGGVTSSQYLKAYLKHHCKDLELIFCDPRYAVDNAVGIAEMCRRSFQK